MKKYFGVFKIRQQNVMSSSYGQTIRVSAFGQFDTAGLNEVMISMDIHILFDSEEKALEHINNKKEIGLLFIQPVYITGLKDKEGK